MIDWFILQLEAVYIYQKKKKKNERGEKDDYLPRYRGGRIFPESSCDRLVPFVSPSCTVTPPSASDGRLLRLCKTLSVLSPARSDGFRNRSEVREEGAGSPGENDGR